jgi:hypothetical protein
MTEQDSAPGEPAGAELKVLGKAAAEAATRFELTNAQLAAVLGISAPSASRLRNGQGEVLATGKARELALLFVRLFRGIYAITGGDHVSMRSWLRSENLALHARPIDLIATVTGLTSTVQYVDSRRARV